MNVASGLIHLGFESGKDFHCVDNADGRGPYIAEWYSDKPQPSEAEIAIAVKAYEAEWDAKEYARKRAGEYLPLGEQLDMLYWDKKDGTNTWEQHIDAVKAKYPKS
ncbi:MAG: XkdW family protein [Chloroflexota bacterium]|nr:XkdW family protein [Chloroflexota bacterium]